MTWLVWRRRRAYFLAAAGVALLLALVQIPARTGDVESSAANLARGLAVFGLLGMPMLVGLLVGVVLAGAQGDRGDDSYVYAQSVSRVRWWRSNVAVGIALTIVVAGVATLIVQIALPKPFDYSLMESPNFEQSGIAPIFYALTAFAVAATVGLLTRNALTTTVVTVVVFVVLEFALLAARSYYVEPLTFIEPFNTDTSVVGPDTTGEGSLYVSQSFADAAGRPVPYSAVYGPVGVCSGATPADHCELQVGVVSRVTAYQPLSRYWPFQWIESAILLAITTVVLAVGALRLRRADIL